MNIITNGVLYIAYMAILFICYLVLSTPFANVVSGIENTNITGVDGHVDATGAMIRLAFDFSFALAGLIPTIWFIAWVMHREPDWRYRQY